LLSDSSKLNPLSELPRNPRKHSFNLEKVIYEPREQEAALKPTYQKIRKHIDDGAFKELAIGSLINLDSGEVVKKGDEEFYIQNIASLMTLSLLIDHFYSIKAEAFKEEVEWRLVSLLINNNDVGIPDDCLFHPYSNKIRPYRSFELIDLNVNPIERIVLGPKNSTPAHVIDSFMKQNNFINVKVSQSIASYI
jgi:hypothetical protein